MRTATAHLKSSTPYSQSRNYSMDVPKENKEASDEYEKRTWRNRMHVINGKLISVPNPDENIKTPAETYLEGLVMIPPMSWKNCTSEAAKYANIQIKGKGKNTYTKHFEAGVMVTTVVELPLRVSVAPGEWLYVPADGRRGGPKRVWKCFPIIREWEAKVDFHILDEVITEEIFAEVLADAGQFIGIGRFRPRNNGYYGRFDVAKIVWREGT